MSKIIEYDLFDMGDTIGTVASKLNNVYTYVDETNNDSLASLYLSWFKARHNLIHYFINLMFNRKGDETKMGAYFPKLEFDLQKLTPDVVLINGNNVCIIEVSVTTNPTDSRKKKENKYNDLVFALRDQDYNAGIHCVAVKSDFTNLEMEISDLCSKVKFPRVHGFWFQKFYMLNSMLDDIKNYVLKHIDKEYWSAIVSQRFTENIEKKGISKDVDIDIEAFKKCSKEKYNTDVLFSFIDKFENLETEYIKKLSDILEQKTTESESVYEKFKDRLNSCSQYNNAEEELLKKNSEYEIEKPKPSHHFFPAIMYENNEVKLVEGLNGEQTMIKNFFEYVKKN